MRRTVVIALALAGLTGAAAPARAADIAVIAAAGYQYIPADDGFGVALEIDQGTTLYFVNTDPAGPHTVTGEPDETGAPSFDTPDQLNFGSFAEVARVDRLEPGTYAFFCTTHYPDMWGTLVVRPAP